MISLTVIGGGVVGLTTAIRLLEEGLSVSIIAREFSPNTTSDVAAAFWYPGNSTREHELSGGSLGRLRQLSEIEGSGVSFVPLFDLYDRLRREPSWRGVVPDYSRVDASEFPEQIKDGFTFATARIETPVYMSHLLSEFERLGGTRVVRELKSLDEIAGEFEVVVNCSGAGAGMLVPDPSCYPVRGQVVLVEKSHRITERIVTFRNETTITYVVPRDNDILLGGTKKSSNSSLEADPLVTKDIIRRCSEFYPELAEQRILDVHVGLRPGRDSIRIEKEELPCGLTVIHNYGHGSGGHSFAWGSAAEVFHLCR